MYAALLGMMTLFAVVPAIARHVSDTLPSLGAVDVAHADAFGLFGTAVVGAYFGAYHGLYGTPWMARPKDMAVLAAYIALAIYASIFASDSLSGQFGGETVPRLVAAAGNVAMGAMGVALAANLVRRYNVGNKLKCGAPTKEFIVLSVIFGLSLAAAYTQCADAGPFRSGDATLQYAAPLLVTAAAVAGVLLGPIYSSYRVWYGAQLQFGLAVVAIMIIVFGHPDLPLSVVQACGDDVIWPVEVCYVGMCGCMDPPDWLVAEYMRGIYAQMLTFAILVVALEMLVAMLGRYYSARMQKRAGAG